MNVSEVSIWPRLEGFLCEQWSVIRKWAGLLTCAEVAVNTKLTRSHAFRHFALYAARAQFWQSAISSSTRALRPV